MQQQWEDISAGLKLVFFVQRSTEDIDQNKEISQLKSRRHKQIPSLQSIRNQRNKKYSLMLIMMMINVVNWNAFVQDGACVIDDRWSACNRQISIKIRKISQILKFSEFYRIESTETFKDFSNFIPNLYFWVNAGIVSIYLKKISSNSLFIFFLKDRSFKRLHRLYFLLRLFFSKLKSSGLLPQYIFIQMMHFKSLLTKPISKFGSFAGPYNPMRYRDHFVPKSYPTNKELYDTVRNQDEVVLSPVRNMRHVNPVRQSGPLPAYSGTYTMEDIKKVFEGTHMGYDFNYCQMDVDEVMRRVPGISRKEVEHIVKMGFSPLEQVDYAYMAYNLGLDVFYMPNTVYIARQVVTNSKGQKVEIFWNSLVFEDMSTLNVGFAPILETIDYHWQVFLWADPPIKVTGDLDLGVPNTWFEYEQELSTEMVIAYDQTNIPEDIRPFNTPRNPYARKELWKSQDQLELEKKMQDPEWKLPTI